MNTHNLTRDAEKWVSQAIDCRFDPTVVIQPDGRRCFFMNAIDIDESKHQLLPEDADTQSAIIDVLARLGRVVIASKDGHTGVVFGSKVA